MTSKAATTDLAPIYVLRVRGETKAAEGLAEIGVSSWAPTYKRLRSAVRGRKPYLVETPLIAGYVFARLRPQDFAAAFATERVHGVITRMDGTPAILPESELTHVLMMVISGKFDDREPATKARPRGYRKRGLAGLQAWFDAAQAGQLKSSPNNGTVTVGGEPVLEGTASSRRSTKPSRTPAAAKVRSFADLKIQIGAA